MALSIPGTDLTASGPTISGLAAAAVTAGRVVRLIASGGGGWRHALANSDGNATGMLGIALTSAAVGGTLQVALPGSVVRYNAMTDAYGVEMFLSTTVWGGMAAEGAQTFTTGQVIQSIGFKLATNAFYVWPRARIVYSGV
jgi:hypothetical protein